MTRTARVKAFAKLNLGLRVLYKRPDGYHELRTVFQTISLGDEMGIEFRPARKTRIEIDTTPQIPDNLMERAANLVMEVMKIHGDVRFKLKKNIPAGAGLGGGSTDAAAVLLALPVLGERVVPMTRLLEIGASLGSDVPFFLQGGTALAMGRGEELYPLPEQPRRKALLVAPEVHSSTAEAYRDLSARLTSNPLQNKLDSFQTEIWRGVGAGSAEGVVNDFEEVVFSRHPEIRGIKERLLEAGASPAAMTGSGSAVFGIFDSRDRLSQTRKSFGEQTFEISFVSRKEYRSAWRRFLAPHLVPTPLKGDLWPPRSPYAR